ncbi:hypothetical protein AQUCO_03800168v1 [Aquilegia coerulea]|uniref:Ubiquitin-like domain-containing protein n=1 Tax=Aquilegia coerulea TaxID=218851 RepID=A0A2G5CSV0_AQUCA|nr:hypothetical protein AQUCO_03800168v1 [Aquilegia coerulea]
MSQIGKIVTLDVDVRDTVYTLKGKIKNNQKLSTSQLDLLYLLMKINAFIGGVLLDNLQFLSAYKIQNDATLYALFRVGDAMQVNVSLEQAKTTINLQVKSWYSVENVKTIIQSMEGISTKKQKLYLTGVKLENQTSLADLNIAEGDTLDLTCGMLIFVKTIQGTWTLEVDSSDLIEDVKQMIEEKQGIPTPQQRLIYDGTQLEDFRTLADYEMNDEASLDFMLCLCGC